MLGGEGNGVSCSLIMVGAYVIIVLALPLWGGFCCRSRFLGCWVVGNLRVMVRLRRAACAGEECGFEAWTLKEIVMSYFLLLELRDCC
jgi:hypothetical protein